MISLTSVRLAPKGLMICVAVLGMHWCTAVDFTKVNTAYWYDPGIGLNVNYRVAQLEKRISVFISIDDALQARGDFNFFLQEDFDSESEQVVDLQIDTLSANSRGVMLHLRFDEPRENLLVLSYTFQQVELYYPVLLSKGRIPFPEYYPVDSLDRPILSNFVNHENFGFRHLGKKDTLYFYQYAENFPPADPPTGSVQTVSPTIEVDSAYSGFDSYHLTPHKFYFIQKDTLSNQGLALYACESYYPNSRYISELLGPITYFTRSSELSKILSSSDPKKEFDQFWLNTYQTNDRARNAIRNYYRRVRQANEQFTDYKQGWKTDRGILFVVFGPPEEVYRDRRSETWRYGDTVFEFRIISNLFAPTLYVLLRDKQYDTAWVNQIRTLREGG